METNVNAIFGRAAVKANMTIGHRLLVRMNKIGQLMHILSYPNYTLVHNLTAPKSIWELLRCTAVGPCNTESLSMKALVVFIEEMPLAPPAV